MDEKTYLRRRTFNMCSQVEKDMTAIVSSIESLGVDRRLTEAINKVYEAREMVSDFIDQTERTDSGSDFQYMDVVKHVSIPTEVFRFLGMDPQEPGTCMILREGKGLIADRVKRCYIIKLIKV